MTVETDSRVPVSRRSTYLRRHLRGSTFQLLSGVKNYAPDEEEPAPRRFTSMRTVKSAPFKREMSFKSAEDDVSGGEVIENELKRSLYDQIDNASLFSDRTTTASVKNYNYKNVLEKHPALKYEAEGVRQRLFRNYMKVFEGTSSNFKENAHSYEKNDIKNASGEISNLVFLFERDSTNRVFIESRNKRARELKSALDAIEAKKNEKAKREAAKLEAEKEEAANVKPEILRKVSVFSTASSGESKLSSKHSKQHIHAKRASESRQSGVALEEKSVVFAEPVVVEANETAANSYDDFDYLVDTTVEEDTNHTKKVKITDDAPNVVVFNQNEDEKFYSRNKHKFPKNIEQAHKSMYRFARQASDKLDKLCPRPDRPKLRTASELNIDEDSIKKQIRLKRLARMLENADGHTAPVNTSDRQRANTTINKIASLNQESDDDDDDDYDNEDDDEANRRQYRMKMKKTHNYVKVLKYMYAKAQKNQKKIDGILSKGQNNDFQQKKVSITQEADALAHSPLLQVALPVEDYRETASQKPAFRISVPFRRDNISNYEIFIPHHNLTSYSLLSGRSTSSNLSDNRFYDLSSNITNGLGEFEKKLLPLSIDALKVSGLKVLEPKSKSIYWQNYNSKAGLN